MRFNFFRKSQAQPDSAAHKEPAVITALAIEPQSHLEEYLAYYMGNLRPGYAVLVTGEWGTGKTHQVRRALPDTHANYISLFGLNTPNEIEAQIFTKMFPTASSISRFAEKLDSATVGLPVWGSIGTGGLAGLLAGTFIKNQVDNSRVLILDDLERCNLENAALLGLINRYVEHHGCRVIVIAHDHKLVGDFADAKEKIFGQTLQIVPNVELAFWEFVKHFSVTKERNESQPYWPEVLSIFRESQIASMRILRHVAEDVGRLADALEDRHLQNDMAIVEVVRLFSALAFEARANRLSPVDLLRRKERILSASMDAARPTSQGTRDCPIYDASKRYTLVDIGSTLLADDVLREMLFDGRYDKESIRKSLNNSHYFMEKQAAPPWRIVINFDKLDDEHIEPALARMSEQFVKRQVTEAGEFLHIVALQMMMASRGVLGVSPEQIARDAKCYIDDLTAEKRLPPAEAGGIWTDRFQDAYGGHMYWVTDSYRDEFESVIKYLVDARRAALNDALPDKVPALLEAVRADGQKFFGLVCSGRNETAEYVDVPILAFVAPAAFVDAWLESPKAGWYWIGSALKERQKMLDHYPNLKSENGWYSQVHDEMLKRAHRQQGLARIRIERVAELIGSPGPANTD